MYVNYIPDGFWPSHSSGDYPSHEAVCVLNTAKTPVKIDIILYFEDREPMKGFHMEIAAQRTYHIRMDRIKNEDGVCVPQDTPYAMEIRCSHKVELQYSRVDTSQSAMAVATTRI